MRRSTKPVPRPVTMPGFFFERRDRNPGTHFAAELGRTAKPRAARDDDPHVDEDLGCSAFGIDLKLPRTD